MKRWIRSLFPATRRPITRANRLAILPLEDRTVPATFTVTTTADSGTGSLRDAVNLANTTAGDDTITFQAGLGDVVLTSAVLFISDTSGTTTITGPTTGTQVVTRSTAGGTPKFGIFSVGSGVTVDMSGLTISNGDAGIFSVSGGIINSGTLTLTNSTLSGNKVLFGGGGIFNSGTLTLANSTLSGNTTGSSGGGILNSGTVTLTNSTLSGNIANENGGGIFNSGTLTLTASTLSGNKANGTGTSGNGGAIRSTGTATLTNVTISGNQANREGGGISTDGILTVVNNTIVANIADVDGNATGSGGGLRIDATAGKTVLTNTIVAGNNSLTTPQQDIQFDTGKSTVDTSSSNNLIGSSAFAGGLTNGTNGNIVGNAGSGTIDIATVLNPTLANNGGPTQTHALLAGSKALGNASGAFDISRLGTPSQSSTLDGNTGSFGPQLAVDGVVTNFSHTASTDTNPSWMLTYPSKMSFGLITLSNRTSVESNIRARFRDITVEVLDAANKVVATSALLNPGNTLNSPTTLTFDAQNAIGQAIRVRRTTDRTGDQDDQNTLTLAEVNVIGRPAADQRGFVRPDATQFNVDIGAFEVQLVVTAPATPPGGTIGTAYNQTLTANFPNQPAGTTYTFAATGALPTGLTLSPGGVISGTPTAGGSKTFSVLATASTGDFSIPTNVTIAVNTPPVAVDDKANTPNAMLVTIDVLANDTDANNDALSISVGKATNGTTAVVNGKVTYTPNATFAGDDKFTYTINDGSSTATANVTVTVAASSNALPTISDITDKSTSIGTAVPISFTVGDAETAVAALIVTGTSDKTTLVPNANITFGGSGANRTVTVTPAAGQTGTATITVTVSDGTLTASDTFVLTVTAPLNTPPTISDVGNQSSTGAAVGPLNFTVGDAETAVAALTVMGKSNNATLVPDANIVLGGSGANRTVTVTPVANQSGTAIVTLTVTDGSGVIATDTFSIVVTPTATDRTVLVGFKEFAAGADVGGSTVNLYNPEGSTRFTVTPFPGFTGGVRTASADFNRDGVADLVVGTGPGRATRVIILDGKSQAQLFSVDPFEASFTGGVYVSAGDVNADGIPDLAITPDEGGGPRADVYSGAAGFPKIISFFGIDDPNFRGGARAAIADMTGDGAADLIVVAGFGGGPRVAGFDGRSLSSTPRKIFGDFFAFEQGLRNGIFVTVGDLNGDGKADLIAGGGPGGGPRVLAFDGANLMQNQYVNLANFFAGNIDNRGGVRLAVKDLDGDNRADLVVGSGAGAGSRVTSYLGKNIGASGTPIATLDFDALAGFTGGVFVG